jgi:AcrR family transcriptional regulator
VERVWRDRPEVARRLFVAAVDAFAENGYHPTTTRDLASRVGLSPAVVYVHFKTKEDLLYEISRTGNREALRTATVPDQTTGPAERLATIVTDYASFLATHHKMARVILHEYNSLTPKHHNEISAVRRRTIATIREAVEVGVESGDFSVPDVTSVVTAIMAMCVDITNWFPSRECSEPRRIGSLYANYALRMVGSTVNRPGIDAALSLAASPVDESVS